MNNSYISPLTITLYISVLVIATFFAFLATSIKRMDNGVVKMDANVLFLFLSAVPPFFLLAYSECGADHQIYNYLFTIADNFSDVNGFDGMEKGFTLLVYLIRMFTKDVNLYNSILAFIFLGLIYSTFYRLRSKLHVGWAVLLFISVFYFQYLDLKRIYITGALVFFATPYWLKKDYKIVFFILILASLFHVSSILMFIPLIMDLFLQNKYDAKKIAIFAFLFLVLLIIFREYLFFFRFDARHQNYGLASNASIGFSQFIYNLPILVLYIIRLKKNHQDRLLRIGFLTILCAFCLGMFSYYFEMIGRAFVHFMMPFLFFPTIFLYIMKSNDLQHNNLFLRSGVIILYCAIRLYYYFSSYLVLDQISPYTTIYGDVF